MIQSLLSAIKFYDELQIHGTTSLEMSYVKAKLFYRTTLVKEIYRQNKQLRTLQIKTK